MHNTSHRRAVPAGWLATHRLVWGGRGLLSHSSRSKYSRSPSTEEWSCTELHSMRDEEGQVWQQTWRWKKNDLTIWGKMCREKASVSSMTHTHTHTKLTCWVQAFCSHSWPATGNPGAPLNWTESPGVAHWPAGMEGAHWWVLQQGRLYYPVLGVGVCPPPGLKWLTGEQLLLPLKDKNRIWVRKHSTIYLRHEFKFPPITEQDTLTGLNPR